MLHKLKFRGQALQPKADPKSWQHEIWSQQKNKDHGKKDDFQTWDKDRLGPTHEFRK